MTSKTVAVPMSTTIERARVEVVGADRVGDSVGAHLAGVVVEDRHARSWCPDRSP